jgi:hypothetical protein
MNKILNYLMLILISVLTSCNKEKAEPVIFTPTDHIIRELGSKMRFVIKVPEKGFYNFSSDDSTLNCEGSLCRDFLVTITEMNELAQNLSDTIIFQWKFMTAASPYPEEYCELLIYGRDNHSTAEHYDYMCSIGKGSSAIDILRELSKSLSGDAKAVFDEIISYLKD